MLQLVPLSITLAGRKPRAESRARAEPSADMPESPEPRAESRAAGGRAR